MSPTTTHPTLVLVPGSFVESSHYDPIVLPLREKGYSIHALDPPCYPKSYKKGTPSPSMYDDAKFVNEFVKQLAKKGENVVVLAHSYGGAPATESLKGVTKKEREAQGKKGGVVRIAYISAIVPRVGENPGEVISAAGEGQGGVPAISVDEDGWMTHTEPATTAAMCFNNLSPERGAAEAAKFGKHAGAAFASTLTYNGYKDVPVSWFFCEDDLCVVPKVQQTAIDAIEESWVGTEREGTKVDVTKVMCDHMPVFSAQDELKSWVESVIVKGAKED